MGVITVTTIGLVIWIVLWAFGVKGFDAFMLTTTLIVIAAGGRILSQYLPGRQDL